MFLLQMIKEKINSGFIYIKKVFKIVFVNLGIFSENIELTFRGKSIIFFSFIGLSWGLLQRINYVKETKGFFVKSYNTFEWCYSPDVIIILIKIFIIIFLFLYVFRRFFKSKKD